jgi:hypothetical protein
MEELATRDVHIYVAASKCAVDIISTRDCQIIVNINTGFSVTY